MSDTAKGLIDQTKPWRSDVRWYVVAIEALVLAALGLYMLIDTDRAGEWILQIIGLVFLAVSLQLAATSFHHDDQGLGSIDSFRAGVGVTVGIVATSIWWSDYAPNNAVRLILGWGLVAFAALQLFGLVTSRGRAGVRVSALVLSGLTFVLGIILLISDSSSADEFITFLGVVMLVFAVLMAGLAWLIYSRQRGVSQTR